MTAPDIDESYLYEHCPSVLRTLLKDRTTRRNILWATDDYEHLSEMHTPHSQITPEALTGHFAGVISPRVLKHAETQALRTKAKAEVFTPAWLCNYQNSLVDDAWFGRTNVFNTPIRQGWHTNKNPVAFEPKGPKTWKRYVDERRLEITCGEAPYLVSRYDATTGEPIKLQRRIGLLDRKMRVVKENAADEAEWLKWAERAYQSVYGFEFQGDSLLLARENLLISFYEYMHDALNRIPTTRELERIALIVSWNMWQMDAFTGTIPYQTAPPSSHQTELFTIVEDRYGAPCRIRDWRAKKTVTYLSLLSESKFHHEHC